MADRPHPVPTGARPPARPGPFEPLFQRWASRVRRRLALRHALTGAAIGLAIAMIPASLAWRMRHGQLRYAAPVIGAVGAAIGLAIARRRRWTDSDVALYLDRRLGTQEQIATAVEMQLDLGDDLQMTVVTSAAHALATVDGKRARPSLLRPVHALLPLALAALAAIARAPLPPPPLAPATPGTTKVQLAEVEGLEKIAQLAQLQARDDAQKERLEKIAKDAEKLREELKAGLEKRDAQDKIARIEDAIAQERLSLGDGEKRGGLESAVGKLEENDLTKKAAKALGDHDLESMDSEMEKVANQREKADREIAKKALENAADAARKNGAPDVAKALDDEKKLMDARGKRAEMLRDLAKGMDAAGESNDELKAEADALDRKGSDKAAEKLADSMGNALEKLTPEERKRLADKLKQMAKGGAGGQNGDPQSLKDLAEQLSTPEGQKKLEDQLKDLAKEDTESPEAKRQKELDDAQKGAQDAEKDIGKQGQQGQGQQGQGQQGQGQQGQGQQGQGQQGQGQGQQGQGQGQQGQGQQGQGQQGQGQGQQGQGQQGQGQQGQGQGQGQGHSAIPIPMNGQGNGNGGGGSHDQGTGDHSGKTNAVDAQTLKSRAKGPMNRSNAMPGTVTTFSQGKAGGTANTRGTGDLRNVGPSEVDGVERSDVPEEYRDQVRQYFQP